MKLHNFLKKKNILGTIGIEIEAEGANMRLVNDQNSLFWNTERDGSLRGSFPDGAAEFVLRNPIKAELVGDALKELAEIQKDAKFNFSHRTSVHIHLNVLDNTVEDLGAILTLYYMFEDVLMNFCGEDRKGNHFCLRYRDAEGISIGVQALARGWVEAQAVIGPNQFKYAALNLAPMFSYGSIEFRAMEGNMDIDRLNIWIGAILKIREYAAKHKTAKEIYQLPFTMPADAMFDDVFGEYADALRYPGYLDDMAMSRSISLEVPFFFDKE